MLNKFPLSDTQNWHHWRQFITRGSTSRKKFVLKDFKTWCYECRSSGLPYWNVIVRWAAAAACRAEMVKGSSRILTSVHSVRWEGAGVKGRGTLFKKMSLTVHCYFEKDSQNQPFWSTLLGRREGSHKSVRPDSVYALDNVDNSWRPLNYVLLVEYKYYNWCSVPFQMAGKEVSVRFVRRRDDGGQPGRSKPLEEAFQASTMYSITCT